MCRYIFLCIYAFNTDHLISYDFLLYHGPRFCLKWHHKKELRLNSSGDSLSYHETHKLYNANQ